MKKNKTILTQVNKIMNKNILLENDNNSKIAISITDDSLKDMVLDFRTHIKDVISFNAEPMQINYNQNEATWTGTLNGEINWTFHTSDDGSDIYITMDNVKISNDLVLAIHKLNELFQNTWLPEVKEKIHNKEYK